MDAAISVVPIAMGVAVVALTGVAAFLGSLGLWHSYETRQLRTDRDTPTKAAGNNRCAFETPDIGQPGLQS